MLTRTAARSNAKSKSAARVRLPQGLKIAVIVPCYNEEAAIGTVVKQFRAALPAADIYVYDNNSKDGTVAAAKKAGAIVGIETRQGKGHVVRRMFGDIDADVYVMIDGDATYDAPSAPKMIAALVSEKLDMVVGARVDQEVEALSPRPSLRQLGPHRVRDAHLRQELHRYSFRLPHLLAALREILPGAFHRI